MKTIGRLKDIGIDYVTKKAKVLLEIDAHPEELERLLELDLSVELKQYRKKRSLDANAYYWTLLSEIAKKSGQTTAWHHNELLRRHGEPEVVEGKLIRVLVPETDKGQQMTDENPMIHLKPTSELDFTGGVANRVYILLRGSHTYDTKEMSVLIEDAIEVAKEWDIDTLTPEQKERMLALYEQHYATRH